MRRRAVYLTSASVVIGLGLASRRYGASLPSFVAQYAGDTLWALAVFLGLGIAFPAARTRHRALLALGLSYVVEYSQLFHPSWLEALRRTAIGGLVLGMGFLWSDIVCYTVGIGAGAALEMVAARRGG